MTMHFTDAATLSAVVSALDPTAASRLVATQVADGWDLTVPDDLAATVSAIDAMEAETALFKKRVASAVDAHCEGIARARNYNSAASCASYVSSTNTAWAAEARVFVDWRDAVWTKVFATLAAVEGGSMPVPTLEAILADLPEIIWPTA